MEEIIKYFADVLITNLYDAKIDFYKNPQSLAELVIATKKETDEQDKKECWTVRQKGMYIMQKLMNKRC